LLRAALRAAPALSRVRAPRRAAPHAHLQEHVSLGAVDESVPLLAFVAAFVRAIILQLLLGAVRANSPFEHSTKVHKLPKPTDTLSGSFYDRSVFVGGKTISFIDGFSWFALVQAIARVAADDANGWGGYIVYTVFVFIFLGFASVLAVRGAGKAILCHPIKLLGNGELLYYSTVAIQLGWAVQNSYNTLINNAVQQDTRRQVIITSLGATMMLTLWLAIIFTAIFGRVRRFGRQEQDMSQL
jgi:hypothetical protein